MERMDQRSDALRSRASVQDRALSLFFDVIVLFPFFSILLSPLMQKLQIQWSFAPESEEFFILLLISVGSYLALFWGYFAICFWRFGKTLGQHWLRLQVRSSREPQRRALSWGEAFLRSTGFFLCLLPFAAPFLALFSHPDRKAAHDLISETEVWSQKQSKEFSPPHFLERHFVMNLSLSLSFVFLLWVGLVAWGLYHRALTGVAKSRELLQEKYLCEIEVSQGVNRLDEALAQYLGQEISASCLEREADFALWTQSSDLKAWAYWAKSHLQTSVDWVEKYRALVCSEDSQSLACRSLKGEENPSLSSRVGNILQMAREGQWEEALSQTQELQSFDSLKALVRAKQSWSAGQDSRAQGIFEGAFPFLNNTHQKELAPWMCFEEVQNSCSSQGRPACALLENVLPTWEESVPALAIAALMLDKKCQKQPVTDLLVRFPRFEKLARILQDLESRHPKILIELDPQRFSFGEELRSHLWMRLVKQNPETLRNSQVLQLKPTGVWEKEVDRFVARLPGSGLGDLRRPASESPSQSQLKSSPDRKFSAPLKLSDPKESQ